MRVVILMLIVLFAGTACNGTTAPSDGSIVHVTGTVQFLTFEGGFWAIRGDDGVTYDPLGGVAPAFQQHGLRVRMHARLRTDLASTHLVGPIVEIISLERI